MIAPDHDQRNLEIRTGVNPLWMCLSCRYTITTYAVGPCRWCKEGKGRPDLSYLRDPGYKPPVVDWQRVNANLKEFRRKRNKARKGDGR